MNKYQESLNWVESELTRNCYSTEQYFRKAHSCIDTLQELISNYKQLKNEFCLNCGKYKNEHLGACKGCKWYER